MTVYLTIVFKGAEIYVWRYDRDHLLEILHSIGRMAADPELDFSWADAAKTCKRIRERMQCSN